ncbi:uncharacterized protein CLUP02_13070 [Colletotrichum lupini]|uniref:Uncharacterized protein n=1 Tax=Colletotrichum lupini TaxID=145971 RepID=A0A9Q8T1L5_9PEZI|nr:uncharacterized protein CLUP02_13070 [Colletotrichum lupini]UQC87553.1 hypothetical protein CLUP02_13070 [Colletotrichum lupini]
MQVDCVSICYLPRLPSHSWKERIPTVALQFTGTRCNYCLDYPCILYTALRISCGLFLCTSATLAPVAPVHSDLAPVRQLPHQVLSAPGLGQPPLPNLCSLLGFGTGTKLVGSSQLHCPVLNYVGTYLQMHGRDSGINCEITGNFCTSAARKCTDFRRDFQPEHTGTYLGLSGEAQHYRTRFATLFSQIHVLLVHQQLEYKNSEPQDSGNDFEEFSDDSDRERLFKRRQELTRHFGRRNSVHFARPLLLKRKRTAKSKEIHKETPNASQNAKPAIAQIAREEFHGDLAQVQPVPANDPVHQATAFRDRLSVQPNSASQITDMIDPDPTCLSFDVVTQSPPPHSQHHQTPIWFDGRHSSDRSGQLHIMSTPLWPMSNMTTSNQLTSFGVGATSLVGFSGSAEVFQQMDPAAYL